MYMTEIVCAEDASKEYAGQVRIWSWSDDILTAAIRLEKILSLI
jgi:hypothetical protein